MRLIKKNSIIISCGMLLIIAGIIFPGITRAAVPSVCDGTVTDLTAQENVYVGGNYSADPTNCYSFTVGNTPGTLTVTLKYSGHINGVVNLDMNLWNSSQTLLQNSSTAFPQGEESLFETASPGETYYIQVNGAPDMDGYPYQFKWFDQDNTADPPTITDGSEDPADGAEVLAGASGQYLAVEVTGADSCTIHYGTDTGTSASVAGTINGAYCEATVAYSANMTDNGTNYWYVMATNTVGSTRYPTSGTLSFTVSTSNNKPVLVPMLMLLLNKKNEEPTPSTNPVIMPWLMLLL